MLNKKSQLSLVRWLPAVFVFCFIAMLSACDDDDENGNKFVGKYKLASAALSTELAIEGQGTLPVGTDITEYVKESLFGVVTCTDEENSAIELRSNKELHFICIGESGDTQGGLWTSIGDTQLILNLSNPPFPQALVVTVTNITINGNTLTGDIEDLPFPGAIFGDPGTLAYLVDFEIEFTKQ